MSNNNETFVTKATCSTSYNSKVYLVDHQRYVLMAFDLALMILNLFTNIAVLIVLSVPKFCQNTSYMLIFYLSLSDSFSALIPQSLYLTLIARYFDQSYCVIEIIANFFAVFSSHISGYTVVAIAFDRYMRMRFLNRYHYVVTKQRIIISCYAITFISFCVALLYSLGTQLNIFAICKATVHVIDFFVVTLIISIYLLTVKILRDHQRNSKNKEILKNVNKRVAVLAYRILVIISMFYGVYIIISISYTIFVNKVGQAGKSWLSFTLFCGYLITYFNSFTNAAVFLATFKRSREKIILFFKGNTLSKFNKENMLTNQLARVNTKPKV